MGAAGAMMPCSSGTKESRAEDTMGGKTGGRSSVSLGRPGGGEEGTGLGDGMERRCSPDALRTGDGGLTGWLWSHL